MGEISTCLVIDDDLDDQEIFALAIENVGDYKCIFSSNAMEAIEQLQKNAWKPDYIFLDLNMPRMNGIQCLQQIKLTPHIANIPVVIYSTSSEQKYINEALRLGSAAFVTKPSRISDFSQILKDFFIAHPVGA